MKISQLSQKTGVSTRSIRHYEKKGLLKVSRLANQYRQFNDSSVETIKTIQLYLSLGLTTDQIRDILYCDYPENKLIEKDSKYCAELLQLYEIKHTDIIRQRKALADAQLRLEKQIELMKKSQDDWK